MPMIHVNATARGLAVHGKAKARIDTALNAGLDSDGPVIVMIHGFKYRPGQPANCPHKSIFAQDSNRGLDAWPRNLGFGRDHQREGLGIAFGWDARGWFPDKYKHAQQMGTQLAGLLALIHARAPHRPVHILAHSLGAEIAFQALMQTPRGAVQRIVSLTGASFRSTARQAMASEAGQVAELINVTSRENDLFDFLFECLVRPPERGDCAVGHGLEARNIVTLQLDHPDHLAALTRLGHPIAPSASCVCHWSGYTRPGVLQLWSRVMRAPEQLPLALMVPTPPAPRWSRLMRWPRLVMPPHGGFDGPSWAA